MKPSVFAALVAALGLLALGLLLAGRPAAPAGGEPAAPTAPRQVTVTGEGTVRLKPDTATMQLGVRSEAATAREAEALNSAAVERVIAALGGLQVSPEEIRVSRGEIHAILPPEFPHGRIAGYRAESRLLVTVHNLKLLGRLREVALEAGATDIFGTSYSLADPEQAKQAAIKAAMENAGERAAALGVAGG